MFSTNWNENIRETRGAFWIIMRFVITVCCSISGVIRDKKFGKLLLFSCYDCK